MTVEERRRRAAEHWTAIPSDRLAALIEAALDEDVGRGDITTALTVDRVREAEGQFVVKTPGVVAGLPVAQAVFSMVSSAVHLDVNEGDGSNVQVGDLVATVFGPARAILTGERLALNFLQRMFGIATATAAHVDAVRETGARVVDTRKTAPGLRLLDKYAVTCGGGHNHRSGLDDGILIKDNHIVAAGGISAALSKVRDHAPQGLKVEIEVDSLQQIPEALAGNVDIILLDNMPPEMLAEAVRRIDGRCRTEASGNVTLETIRAIAETGVDYISIGRLTHSSPALDIGLDLRLI